MKKLIIIILLLNNCVTRSTKQDDTLIQLILANSLLSRQYYSLVEQSINNWDLNIETSPANKRDMDNLDPEHWVGVSRDMNCDENGFNISSIRNICQRGKEIGGENLAGLCVPNYEKSGKINNVTVILNYNFLFSDKVTDLQKEYIITHEIGHCLGLEHVNDINNLMYPSISFTRTLDYSIQKEILKRYYNSNITPNTNEINNYLIKTSTGNFLRYIVLPKFYISVNPEIVRTDWEASNSNTPIVGLENN